ncbi:hypothetical protein [Chryseolinea lacunae]|uniref:Uncharacterized protein n=1 Tax=Chryseolinea lacunae TaxID=2801331 RepID=A0ABS1KU75_9BACT|nr:hypothetical protein [Chryseolinea lacunae]MBL0742753.1 hypothetical protein [Chryseolinea lacunae]
MYSKCWLVIKDDGKRTYEVCGKTGNSNFFTNGTHGMQRAGMNVSYVTPPVTNQNSNKEMVKVSGYTQEDGLHERLLAEYRQIIARSIDHFDDGE